MSSLIRESLSSLTVIAIVMTMKITHSYEGIGLDYVSDRNGISRLSQPDSLMNSLIQWAEIMKELSIEHSSPASRIRPWIRFYV